MAIEPRWVAGIIALGVVAASTALTAWGAPGPDDTAASAVVARQSPPV